MVRHCCGEETTAAGAQTSGEPLFRWNTDKPEPDANFANWKKALLAKGGQGDTLVITGYYSPGGEKTDGEKLAMARAAAIRDMLAPEFPASRVRLATKMFEDDLSATSGPKVSASYAWSKMVLKKEDSAIIESDKDVILLFLSIRRKKNTTRKWMNTSEPSAKSTRLTTPPLLSLAIRTM